MDPILQVLLSYQMIIFGLAVVAVVFVIRKIVEYIMETFFPKGLTSHFYNDVILPIMPILLGVIAGIFFRKFPYPDGLTTFGDRIIFGMVAGLLSSLIYRVVKSLLFQKIQVFTSSISNSAPTVTTTTTISAPTTVPPDSTPIDPVADGQTIINDIKKSL